MTKRGFVSALGTSAVFGVVILGVMFLTSQSGRAYYQEDQDSSASKIQQGFAIAPVTLNLTNKNRALVGLGSYLVNAAGGCNDCHTAPTYLKDPYTIGVTTKEVNHARYLGGGALFGPFTSRNLTPDKSGKPLGGASFSDFRLIIRTGVDLDQWHLNLPSPLNGKVLQVMPWPVYQDLTDHDLKAIYEYLSAIPCVEGDPGNPNGADTHGHRCK
jgi:hypothetical protein